jgi:RHS repeat-associated protein
MTVAKRLTRNRVPSLVGVRIAQLGTAFYTNPALLTGAVASSTTSIATYTYDAMDRRIGVVEGATRRWTVYDGMSPILDFNGSGTQTARYLNGPSPSGVDAVLARETSSGVAWYLPDCLGTIRDIVDNNGSLIDHIDYGVFGNVLAESNTSAGDAFKFAGMRYDAESGMYYDNARWYDPVSGRFVSEDPSGLSARDTMPYNYVNNDSPNVIDPLGLQGTSPDSKARDPIAIWLEQYWSSPYRLHPLPRSLKKPQQTFWMKSPSRYVRPGKPVEIQATICKPFVGPPEPELTSMPKEDLRPPEPVSQTPMALPVITVQPIDPTSMLPSHTDPSRRPQFMFDITDELLNPTRRPKKRR